MRHSAFICLLIIGSCLQAQVPAGGGLIVNEFNQGAATIQEFMEFLVIGDPGNPCAPVDLTGWVFDDNNGSFESCGTGVGIANGHYRFSSCYNAVPPGSLLVVYNASDPYVGMPADDPTDADNDGVYIIPSSSTCLEENNMVPIATPANCNYAGPYIAPTSNWAVGMANSGDVSQVRKPDYSFFHGMSFGNVNTTFPSWPAGADAGTSFNKGSGNLALDCGSFWNSASYIITSAGAGTPGAANTVNNSYFIGHLKNCTLDYADLDDAYNCSLLLPINSSDLDAALNTNKVLLSWQDYTMPENESALILHSTNGKTFDTIGIFSENAYRSDAPFHLFTDPFPANGMNYYLVEWHDTEGHRTRSNMAAIQCATDGFLLYPNPAIDHITLVNCSGSAIQFIRIIDAMGREVTTIIPTAENGTLQISVAALPAGNYYTELISADAHTVIPFIK